MKMSKKVKAAITVAAIAGTCAFSSPSFAAFTATSPERVDSNFNSVTISTTAGDLYAISDGGGVYRTAKAGVYSTDPAVALTKIPADVSSNIVDMIPLANGFAVVAANGKVVITVNGGTTVTVSDADGSNFDGKTVVGIVADDATATNVWVLASDGTCRKYTRGSTTWAASGLADLTGLGMAGNIKGFALETNFYVYGDDATNNLYRVPSGGGAAVALNLVNCPVINDLDIEDATSDWTACGVATNGDAVVIRGITNIETAGAGDVSDTSALNAGTTEDLTTVDYNAGQTYGMAAGENGMVVEITGRSAAAKVSTGPTDVLNGVVVAYGDAGQRRTFVAGNTGVVKYGDDTYWVAASNDIKGDASQKPVAIINNGNTYYAVGNDKFVYSSTNDGSSWTAASLATTNQITAAPDGRVLLSSDNSILCGLQGTSTVEMAPLDAATAATVFTSPRPINDFAVLGANIWTIEANVGATGFELVYNPVGANNPSNIVTPSAGAPLSVPGAKQIAATDNGLYFIDSGGLKAMCGKAAETPDAAHLATAANAGPDNNCAVIDADPGATKIFPLSDADKLAVITAVPAVFILADSAAADVSAVTCSATLEAYPGGAIVAVSGSANAMLVTDDSNVWLYKVVGGKGTWEKYDSVTDTGFIAADSVDGLASNGADVMAIDASSGSELLAFSEGSSFTTASVSATGTDVLKKYQRFL